VRKRKGEARSNQRMKKKEEERRKRGERGRGGEHPLKLSLRYIVLASSFSCSRHMNAASH